MLSITCAYAPLTRLFKFLNELCNRRPIVFRCGWTTVTSVCRFLKIHLIYAGNVNIYLGFLLCGSNIYFVRVKFVALSQTV